MHASVFIVGSCRRQRTKDVRDVDAAHEEQVSCNSVALAREREEREKREIERDRERERERVKERVASEALRIKASSFFPETRS
jgi:hypothetical protein